MESIVSDDIHATCIDINKYACGVEQLEPDAHSWRSRQRAPVLALPAVQDVTLSSQHVYSMATGFDRPCSEDEKLPQPTFKSVLHHLFSDHLSKITSQTHLSSSKDRRLHWLYWVMGCLAAQQNNDCLAQRPLDDGVAASTSG